MTSSSGHVIALDQSRASIWAKRAPFTTVIVQYRARAHPVTLVYCFQVTEKG